MLVAIFGNYGVKNLGDDLILRGLLKVLKNTFSRVNGDKLDFIIFCGNPQRISNNQKLSSHPFFPSGLRSWLKYLFSSAYRKQINAGFDALKSCDRIILGGGGLLVDRRLKAVLLWFSQLRWIKKTGKSFECLGVSFELNRWWTKRLFKPYLAAAARITVRDTSSLALLASLGIHAELVPDFAWHAPLARSLRSPHQEEPTQLGRDDRRKISLSLCRWGLGRRQQKALRTFISERRKQGLECIGLAFQTLGDDDRKIFQRIDPAIRVVSDPNLILQELTTSSLLIGMRYHSLVLALRLKIPFIALSYQEKVSALMRDEGMGKQSILLEDLDSDTLKQVFNLVFHVSLPPSSPLRPHPS